MHKSRPEPSTSRWLVELLLAIQLMGLILNRGHAFPFHNVPAVAPAADAAGAVALGPFLPDLAFSVVVGLTLAAIGFVAVTVSATASACWLAVERGRENQNSLRMLGMALRFSASVGLVPILSLLFSPCQGQSLGYTHFNALHVALLAAGLLCAVAFVAVACATQLLYFNADSTSAEIFSRPHGRVEAATTAATALLVLVLSVEELLGSWLVTIACCLFAVGYTAVHLHVLPHYRVEANAFRAATGAGLGWAATALVVGRLRDTGRTGDDGAALAFWLGLPFVLFCAAAVAGMRAQSVKASPLFSSSPYLVEVKTRMMLYGLMRRRWQGYSSSAGQSGDEDLDGARRAETIKRVETQYRQALQESPNSSLLHRFFAHFLEAYKGSRSLELTHLGRSNKNSPALDTQFLVYLRKQQMEDAEAASADGGMSVAARIKAEKYQGSAMQHEFKCRSLQVQFWEELLERVPSMPGLSSLAKHIESERRQATRDYEALLELNPSAVGVLRSYAQFLIEVANRPARANGLLEEADAIEDEQGRWQQERARDIVLLGSADLDTSSDQTGVCTIGTEGDKQGIVKTVNAYWPHLLGYTRREMVGLNISTIMPEPIATVHNALLSHAIDHGGDNFMSLSRIVMAKHAHGFVFPAVLMVRLLEDAFGGMLQRIETSMHFLLFVERGLKVTGMCERSSSRFGVSPKLCLSEDVAVVRFAPHIRDLLESDLKTLPGGSLSPPHRVVVRAPRQLPDGRLGEMREITAVAKFQRVTLKVSAETLYIMQWSLAPAEEELLTKESVYDDHPAIIGHDASDSGSDGPLPTAGKSRLHGAIATSLVAATGHSAAGTKLRASDNQVVPGAVDPFAARYDDGGEQKEGDEISIFGGSDAGSDASSHQEGAMDSSTLGDDGLLMGEEKRQSAASRAPRASTLSPSQPTPVHIEPAVVMGKGAKADNVAEGDSIPGTAMEGTKSEAGSSHGSSTTSSAAVLPMLRKSVDMHERTLEPGLRALRVSFMWTVLVAGTAAVVTLLVNEFMVASAMDDLDALQNNGRRQFLATRMTADALSLSLAHRGLLPNSTAQLTALRDSLRSASDEFFQLHQDLYDHAVGAGLDAVTGQYTKPSLALVDFDEGQEYTRDLTLLEAGLEFVKRARLVADTPGAVKVSNPDVAFLLANGVDSLPDACNTSALNSVAAATVAKTSVVDLYLWQFAVALLLVEVSLVVFVHPAVKQVKNTKEAVFQLLLDVPRDALSGLRDRAQRLVSTAMDEEEVPEEEGSEDEDERGKPHEEGRPHASPGMAIGADHAAARNSRRRKQAPPRELSRSHAEQFVTTVRFGGGMFIILAFFAANFLQVSLDGSTAIKVPRNVYYSTQRYATSNELYMRAMLYISSEGPNQDTMFNASMEAAAKALYFSQILLFGDEETGTMSELSFSDVIKRQQLDNGCIGDPAPGECAAFKNGLFRSGLAAATRHYLREARVAIRERKQLKAPTDDQVEALLTNRLADVREMDRKYLSRGLFHLLSVLEESGKEKLDATQDGVLFILGSIIYNSFVFSRIIVQYDRDIKRTRAMLLMFPEDAIASTPYIRQLMKRMAHDLK